MRWTHEIFRLCLLYVEIIAWRSIAKGLTIKIRWNKRKYKEISWNTLSFFVRTRKIDLRMSAVIFPPWHCLKMFLFFSYFSHEIWNMKFRLIQIPQFFNTTHNFLTKFHAEFFFQLSGMKLKHLLGILLAKWIQMTLSVWSYDFVSKWFLVRILHIKYVIKVMVWYISSSFA